MNVELRLNKAGTLRKPRIIGRTVRFLLGAASAWYVYDLVSHYGYFVGMDVPRLPEDAPWFLSVLFAFYVFPYIVNIGFSRQWRRRPQLGIIVLGVVSGVIGIVQYGSVWAPPLGWLTVAWLAYVYGHLGISMLVAAIIGTPGCEMRAIPHLWTIISGRQTAEHYCPGFLNCLDNWESSKQE